MEDYTLVEVPLYYEIALLPPSPSFLIRRSSSCAQVVIGVSLALLSAVFESPLSQTSVG